MPIVNILMHKGRTQAQKDALIREVTDAVVRTVGVKPESVQIIIQDVEKSDWGVAGKNSA